MQIHELTTTACREVLSRMHVGRLACARSNQPYVVPISIAFDPSSNCVFSFSAVGKKIDWMRENPKVCLEVEEIEDRFHWTTVVIAGRYSEITTAVEHRDIRARALVLLERSTEWWLPGVAKLGERERHAVVVFQINIDSVTGRRAERDRV
jgi:nitroimidazol reductase NimA-like FMN-containing flavoprotein (pyridoxamine 5'-phosphate oxidase superfamily)